MTIISEDGNRIVDVGTSDILFSVISTINIRLKHAQKKIPLAIRFLESGACEGSDGLETARQFNLIRDQLAGLSPDKAVYDQRDPKKPAPWENNLSSVITSCANLYTTADGKDLLYEIVSILTYGGIVNVKISIQ